MLDGKAYKALLPNGTDSELFPRLRDPALLKAFAALADDLRTVEPAIPGSAFTPIPVRITIGVDGKGGTFM